MANRREVTREEAFAAKDATGKEYQIVRYQEWIIDHEGDRLPSLARFELAAGGAVNSKGNNIFEIVSLGVEVKRA
jgi:hypothetical protein